MSIGSIVWINGTAVALMFVFVWQAFNAIADSEPIRAFIASGILAWAVWGMQLTLQ